MEIIELFEEEIDNAKLGIAFTDIYDNTYYFINGVLLRVVNHGKKIKTI